MKRATFEAKNEENWKRLEAAVKELDRRETTPDTHEVPRLFRQACGDLALAQHRMYPRKLCDRLNQLVISTYQHLQATVSRGGSALVKLFREDFPQAVRREGRIVWVALLLFFIPFIGFLIASHFESKWIYAVLSPYQRMNMDVMYGADSSDVYVRERLGGSFGMFGFYILNNVSIAFRMFAGGILFGVFGAWVIGYQGVVLGAMFGYVQMAGNYDRLMTFAISHSSWELLGIILAGAAGMKIGLAWALPGQLSRGAAIQAAGRRAIPIVLGGSAMIAFAAVIEAFWSPSAVPTPFKYGVGIAGWVFFAAYFLLVGRRNDEA